MKKELWDFVKTMLKSKNIQGGKTTMSFTFGFYECELSLSVDFITEVCGQIATITEDYDAGIVATNPLDEDDVINDCNRWTVCRTFLTQQ